MKASMRQNDYSCSKAVLPLEMALMKDQPCGSDDSSEGEMNMQRYMKGMVTMRDELFEDAKGKIDQAQLRQKQDFDKKHGRKKVNKYYSITVSHFFYIIKYCCRI